MGTPDFAVPTLAELIAQGHDIACVYSQPPRPKGRGMELEPGPVHQFAEAAKLPVRTPLSLKDAEQQALFAALDLDAAVVVAYGLLLPKADSGCAAAGLFQSAWLAAAALARRRADPARGDGGRRRDRRDGDAYGRRAGYRPGADGRTRRHRPQDLWRTGR